MKNNIVSIVIPSRNEIFLEKTVNSLLENATGEIEIIAILDGYWPVPWNVTDKRVVLLHRGTSLGMRNGITSAVKIAKGDYILKIDAHCMVDKGFDEKLKADCEENWVVIPRRKRLDSKNWCIQDVGKPDVDYEYLSFPDNPSDFGGPGLNGRIWTERILSRKDIMIDDNISFQGSCWFMHKKFFHELELMDEVNYGTFWNEAQEIGFKCLSIGGRLVTNKNTWYAHLHKGKEFGRGYNLDHSQMPIGATYTKKWMTNSAWSKQVIPFEQIIEKFMPMPGWPEDWKEIIKQIQ